MSILVQLGFIVAIYTCFVKSQSCSSGTCISLLQCPELLSLINKPNRTPQELERLKSSQCGFEGNSPKVCCPAASEACYTPDGKQGKCINIYQCPHLANMLKAPYSRPDNVNYILNSKCTGSDRYSVCCGPPRDLAGNLNTKCTGIVNAFPPDPDTKCCGLDANVGNKITGGNVTTVDQYPWLALIEYTKDGGLVKTLCGGALISARYVLTAGHCVTGPILNFGTPKNVRLGEYDTSNPGQDCAPADGGGTDCNDGTVVIPIEEIIPHPDYKKGRQNWNDIALIRIKQSAPFTDFIRPICMPTADVTLNNPAGLSLFAAGWGAVSETQPNSAVKLYVDLPFVDRDVCQGAYRAPGRNTNLWEGQICAGGVPGKDSCKGDSGGPLMYESSSVRRHEVVGVVSFGPTPCGLPDIPGVYTKVYEYRAWIQSVIRAYTRIKPKRKSAKLLSGFPPDPNSSCCGQDASGEHKIIGGIQTFIDQLPWLVLLESSKDVGPIKTLCGGALISGRYVLTAGHCVAGSYYTVGCWTSYMSEVEKETRRLLKLLKEAH